MNSSIAIIDPAAKVAETGCFNRLVFESPVPLTYHLPKLGGIKSLHSLPEKLHGILILGSLHSVNDGEPWQREMNDWLKPRMVSGTPTLGLCYGHQLIAHLFGGQVDFMQKDRAKQVGFRDVSLPANRLWGDPCAGSLAVSHCESVTQLPDDFAILFGSALVKVDVMAHKSLPIWGFQSHPEATKTFLESRGIGPEHEDRLGFGHGLVKKFLEFAAQSSKR